jgi:hypothetical protein
MGLEPNFVVIGLNKLYDAHLHMSGLDTTGEVTMMLQAVHYSDNKQNLLPHIRQGHLLGPIWLKQAV